MKKNRAKTALRVTAFWALTLLGIVLFIPGTLLKAAAFALAGDAGRAKNELNELRS